MKKTLVVKFVYLFLLAIITAVSYIILNPKIKQFQLMMNNQPLTGYEVKGFDKRVYDWDEEGEDRNAKYYVSIKALNVDYDVEIDKSLYQSKDQSKMTFYYDPDLKEVFEKGFLVSSFIWRTLAVGGIFLLVLLMFVFTLRAYKKVGKKPTKRTS